MSENTNKENYLSPGMQAWSDRLSAGMVRMARDEDFRRFIAQKSLGTVPVTQTYEEYTAQTTQNSLRQNELGL